MFDTQYNVNNTGLSGCNNHRARRDRAREHFEALPGHIGEVKRKISALETGTLQAEYVSLEELQAKRRKRIAELDNEINKATITRDMWLQNPEVAAGSGLGWFGKRWWNKAFSCDTYTSGEKEFKERSLPLEKELAAVTERLSVLETKFSPSNMQLIRAEAQKLEQEVKIREQKLASILAEIENLKATYNARKEAERLALEQQAREQEAAQLAKTGTKQGNMTTLLLVFGAIVAGAYIFKGKDKPAKVDA